MPFYLGFTKTITKLFMQITLYETSLKVGVGSSIATILSDCFERTSM